MLPAAGIALVDEDWDCVLLVRKRDGTLALPSGALAPPPSGDPSSEAYRAAAARHEAERKDPFCTAERVFWAETGDVCRTINFRPTDLRARVLSVIKNAACPIYVCGFSEWIPDISLFRFVPTAEVQSLHWVSLKGLFPAEGSDFHVNYPVPPGLVRPPFEGAAIAAEAARTMAGGLQQLLRK